MENIYENAIHSIAKHCEKNNIPYNTNPLWGGMQITFPWCQGDMVCHSFSHGHEIGDVESYGFDWDNGDVTELSVEEAKTRISDLYKEYQ